MGFYATKKCDKFLFGKDLNRTCLLCTKNVKQFVVHQYYFAKFRLTNIHKNKMFYIILTCLKYVYKTICMELTILYIS